MIRRLIRGALTWALQPPPVEIACSELVIREQGTATTPSRKYSGDAGFDLYCAHYVNIPDGGFADVHTGIQIKMPDGIWARITNRSSTYRTLGITVLEGIIDNGYTGELFIGVVNRSGHEVSLVQGQRIAQLIFHQLITPRFVKVFNLSSMGERGFDGFGSTGK